MKYCIEGYISKIMVQIQCESASAMERVDEAQSSDENSSNISDDCECHPAVSICIEPHQGYKSVRGESLLIFTEEQTSSNSSAKHGNEAGKANEGNNEIRTVALNASKEFACRFDVNSLIMLKQHHVKANFVIDDKRSINEIDIL